MEFRALHFGSAIRTFGHELRILQGLFHFVVQRQALSVHNRAVTSQITDAWGIVQIVGQRYTVAVCDFQDLMLAVAVECRPLNTRRFTIARGTPVKTNLVVSVPYDQLSSLVRARKADDERPKLCLGTRSVDVCFEETGRG